MFKKSQNIRCFSNFFQVILWQDYGVPKTQQIAKKSSSWVRLSSILSLENIGTLIRHSFAGSFGLRPSAACCNMTPTPASTTSSIISIRSCLFRPEEKASSIPDGDPSKRHPIERVSLPVLRPVDLGTIQIGLHVRR
jgi:hypothetical protein